MKALDVNGSDVGVRYNLAWVYKREHNYPSALATIAEGLSLDKTGQFRDLLKYHSGARSS
jgi:hypothetical protein